MGAILSSCAGFAAHAVVNKAGENKNTNRTRDKMRLTLNLSWVDPIPRWMLRLQQLFNLICQSWDVDRTDVIAIQITISTDEIGFRHALDVIGL